jgi:hypothetical protein
LRTLESEPLDSSNIASLIKLTLPAHDLALVEIVK